MTLKEQEGYEFAKGFAGFLAERLLVVVVILAIFWFSLNMAGCATDDSDCDGWNRSGLRVHVDAKTGVEYLSTRGGGLVRRETK